MLVSAGASAQPPEGCACLWQGSFAEVADSTELVILGEVTQVRGNAVDIAVERSLRGETWLETLRVWMHARDYCRPPVDRFPEGSRWVMALEQITEVPDDGFDPSTPNVSYGRKLDYILPGCGGFHLQANGESVIGNLVPGMPRWEYAPDMTPVLLSLVEGFLEGNVSEKALKKASEEDPAVKSLILDTKSFLRGQDEYLDESQR